jgi:ubiquinone/menaquinone biosynthesis C-methylase UbiE
MNFINRIKNKSNTYKKFLQKYYKQFNNADVLDIGSGNGFSTFILSLLVNKIYGLEPNINALKRARKNKKKLNLPNIRFYQGTAEILPFTRKFNIIRFQNSIQFTQIVKSLNNAFNILEKDGIIIIRLPYDDFSDPKLNKKHSEFNNELFKKERHRLRNVIKIIKNYVKNDQIIYENLTSYYIIIVKS